MNWWGLLAAFVSAAALSGLAVAVSIRVAHRTGALDHPDSERKTQDRPIPRLGGVAVALTYSVLALGVLALFGQEGNALLALGVLLPAVAMAVLGWVDDRRHVQPSVRLLLQALAAATAWMFGTRSMITGVVWIDFALFVLWVVVIINGINLLDNSDGLAGSTVIVASLGATFIAVASGQELVSILGISLAGVALGFLWHNWVPATVYLGDSGAYFLGFLLAVLATRLRPEAVGAPLSLAVPILLLALPILDTVFVVVRRLSAGIHPFTAGRDHLSHELQRRGHGLGRSVLLLQVVSVAGSVAAMALLSAG